jgi:hypothetical protein
MEAEIMSTVEINGKKYNLIPFNSGQMRNQIDPLIKRMGVLYHSAKEAEKGAATVDLAFELNEARREIERENAEILVATIQRKYPDFTAAELDSLTDWQVTALFNEFLSFTRTGGDEPGEVTAPAGKKSR